MTSADPRSDRLKHVLSTMKTIAVVGLSTDPSKDSYRVADYLKQHGYRIIPVNPGADEILGEKSFPDLKSIPEPIDMVDVFRRPEHVPDIAKEAVAVHAKVLWLQLGIESEEGEKIAREGGLTVIQNECTKREHERLFG
jgi:predicted CoA-binding protein